MLIRARRQLPPLPEGQWRRNDYEIVDVEVPDPMIIRQQGDVRVVATFASLCDGDYDYADVETLSPTLVVEHCVGEDALGVKRWSRCIDSSVFSYGAQGVIATLAEMLRGPFWTLTPADYHVVETPVETDAPAEGVA